MTDNTYDVSIGCWIAEGKSPDDEHRVVTYADLVNKTVRMSSEIIADLQAYTDDDINDIYVVDGRQTIPYQQLTHPDKIRVYLKSNGSSTLLRNYRFSGEPGQLPSLSCDSKDPDYVDYELSECVTAADVSVNPFKKIIRFRFDNITFRPCIKFIPGDGQVFCSLVKIERTNDQTNPHDVYIKMMNGRKAKFKIEAYNGSQIEEDYVYIGSETYYSGSLNEYDSSYGGAVTLNYTTFNNPSSFDWLAKKNEQFTVEPYYNNANVNIIGQRNTPIYIEIITDAHISVRNMTQQQYIDASTYYDNQVNYGTVAISPQDYAGHFTTPINDPGHAYVTVMSQDLQKWDRFQGRVIEYKKDIKTEEREINKQTYNPETPAEWDWGIYNWGIELHKLTQNGVLEKNGVYRLELNSIATYYLTTVNVIEWRNLNISYIYNSGETSTGSQQIGQKWIHTFQTNDDVDEENEIKLRAVVTSDTIDYTDIGYNAKLAIVKISQSTNQNSKLVTFDPSLGNGVGATAIVPYKHSSYQLPRTLDLYLRILPNVRVNFFFPKGYQIRKKYGVFSGGEETEFANYNKLQIQFDAETVQQGQIEIVIKRTDEVETHGWNYLTPYFYYNPLWQGVPAQDISFSGLNNYIFETNSSKALYVDNVSFDRSSAEFSIRLTGSQRSKFSLTIFIPGFHSGINNWYDLVYPSMAQTAKGGRSGYFAPTLSSDNALNGEVILYQGAQNSVVTSNEARSQEWDSSSGITYSFDVSEVDIAMLPKTLSGVTEIVDQYLPSTLYKEVKVAETSDVIVEQTYETRPLTNSAYTFENYNLSNPMFKFKIDSGKSNPSVKLNVVKWEDTDIYIFSQIIEIEGDQSYFDIYGITSGFESEQAPNEFKLQTINESLSDSSTGFHEISDSSTGFHEIYKQTLPDWFYGIKNNHKRTFRIRLKRNFEAGSPIEHGVGDHLKEIEKYQMTAYSEYDPTTGSHGDLMFDKTIDCSGKETDFHLDDLSLDENIYNNASNLGHHLGVLVVPIEGEPLLSVAGIHYWMGTGYLGVMEFENAYVSPHSHTSTVEWLSNDVMIYLKFRNPGDYDFSNNETKIFIDDIYTEDFEFGKKVATDDDHTITTQDNTKEYDVCFTIKVKSDLAKVNNIRYFNQSKEPLYGTDMPLTFSLKIIKNDSSALNISRQIKLAPIIDIYYSNDTGENMKPEVDAIYNLRLRSREWQWNEDGSIPFYEGYYGTVNERTCRAEFTYNGEEIPEETPEQGSQYKSRRHNQFFDINAPATWTDKTHTPPIKYIENWGAWEVKIISVENLPPLGTMKGVYTISGGSDMKNWYNGDYSVQFDIVDMITAQRIEWWDGIKYQSADNRFEKALLSPVPYDTNSELENTVCVYLNFKENHGLDLSSANAHLKNSVFNDCFETNVSYNVELDGVTYDLRIGVKTKCVIGKYNDGHMPRIFYTGQEIKFELDINYTSDGEYTYPFIIKLGPVISITHDVAKGRFADYSGYPNGEYFADSLKGEIGQKIVTQSRAHEWFSNDGSTIVMTGNDIVGLQSASDRTVRGRQYDIVWKYNGTNLSEKTGTLENVPQSELLSGESVYAFTREFDNTYLKVQHAAAWTGYDNGKRYNSGTGDGGAWRIEVIDMDSQFTSGDLTAQVTITDVNPEISMYHWYDGGETTVLPVKNFEDLHISRVVFQTSEREINVWDEKTSTEPIKIPGFAVCQGKEDRTGGDIKVYVSGTPLNSYPNAYTWIYFKPLGNSSPSTSGIVSPDSDYEERHNEFQFGYYSEIKVRPTTLAKYDLYKKNDEQSSEEYINENSTYKLIIELRERGTDFILYPAPTEDPIEYDFKFEHIEGLYIKGFNPSSYYSTNVGVGPDNHHVNNHVNITFEHGYLDSSAGTVNIMPGDRRLGTLDITGSYYVPKESSITYSETDPNNNTFGLTVAPLPPLLDGFFITGHTKYNEFKTWVMNLTAEDTKYLHIICKPNPLFALTRHVYFTTKPDNGAQFVASLNGNSSIPGLEEHINLKRYTMQPSKDYTGWLYFTITVKKYKDPNGEWNYYFIDEEGKQLIDVYQPQLDVSTNMALYNIKIDYPMLPFSSTSERLMLNNAIVQHQEKIQDNTEVIKNYIYPVFVESEYGEGPSVPKVVQLASGNDGDETVQPSNYNNNDKRFWPVDRDEHVDPSVAAERNYKGWLYYTPEIIKISGKNRNNWKSDWRYDLPSSVIDSSVWFDTLTTVQNAESIISHGDVSTGAGVIYCDF